MFAFDQANGGFWGGINKGVIRSLDDYITKDKFDTTKFYNAYMEPQRWKGKTWGLPSHGWTGLDGFYYNTELLDRAGVTLPAADSPAWNMNTLYEAVVKVNRMLRPSGGFGLQMFTNGYMMEILGRAFDGDDVSADGKRCIIFEQPQREGYRWLYDLSNKEGALQLPSRAEGNLCFGGNVAIYQEGSRKVFEYDKLAKDTDRTIKAILFPKRKDGKRPSQVRVGTWNTGTKSANPEHGWAFIKHLSTREALIKFNELVPSSSLVRPDVVEAPFFAHPNWQVFLATSDKAMPQSVLHNNRGDEFENAYRAALLPWLAGEVGFEDGLRTMRDNLQRVLDLPQA